MEEMISLEKLEDLLSEEGYLSLGHGTNSEETVAKIFEQGLRTKNNSLYFTTMALSTPTPEIRKQYQELELPEPSIADLKKQLNNWPHLNAQKIIIIRIPTEYINNFGDRTDLDGEMFGAFYNSERQNNGELVYYLDPKFIIGCFDTEQQMVKLNPHFERILSPATKAKLQKKYKIAIKKTQERIARLEKLNPFVNNEAKENEIVIPKLNFDDNIEWDDLPTKKSK